MEEDFQNDIESEDDIITWKVPEYEDQKKNKRWYVIAGVIAVACLIYSFFTSNFAFAVIIVMIIVIIILRRDEEVSLIDVGLADDGIMLGRAFYDYDEIRNFAIVYKPRDNKKNLYFEFKSAVRPRLSIPLNNINPLLIRRNLLKYLEEDLERLDIPLSEQLSRLFKL